jgi:hypothetical protein
VFQRKCAQLVLLLKVVKYSVLTLPAVESWSTTLVAVVISSELSAAVAGGASCSAVDSAVQ